MQDIINGLKMRAVKKAVEVYKDRKIEFLMKKNSLKTSLYDSEIKDIVSFDMPYRGFFNKGIINAFLVNANEFKKYNSNTVNAFLKKLKESGGVSHRTTIFVTEENSYVIQHELQHVFDNIIDLKTPIWEHEYRAFLASLVYDKNPERVLVKLADYVEKPLKEVGYDFFKSNLEYIIMNDRDVEKVEPHELAILKIIVDLDKNIEGEFNEQNLIETSKKLMNKNYMENYFGANYDEILEELEERLSGY